ncbi:sulfite exporter TauE/SafE family protein 3-like [Pistacia vera]|uniref:sulfite exporter TauE/SafE family protein 3-like n=1 Tax=Pistacia vera TaxID=55513 RepID=UPI001263E1EA|nr:sulfite exporter TauE/SafE family protein 3-like [Pistacia vera]
MVTQAAVPSVGSTSTKAFFKGVETWKTETIMKKEAAKRLESNGAGAAEVEYKPLPMVTILEMFVGRNSDFLCLWVAFLGLQISKVHSIALLTSYTMSIYKFLSAFACAVACTGSRVIASKGEDGKSLIAPACYYCAWIIGWGALVGCLDRRRIYHGSTVLELGVPPQVQVPCYLCYDLLLIHVSCRILPSETFSCPYALYFVAVATVAAFIGQHVVRKLIILLGRASLIIFILALTIFISAISLGGVGISNMIEKIEAHDYMGFENLCTYDA